MVTGRLAEDDDREPIQVDGGQIECVKEFSHLGSLIAYQEEWMLSILSLWYAEEASIS